jgi:hypothetical protein
VCTRLLCAPAANLLNSKHCTQLALALVNCGGHMQVPSQQLLSPSSLAASVCIVKSTIANPACLQRLHDVHQAQCPAYQPSIVQCHLN